MQVELVVKGIILDKQRKKVLLLKRSPREDIGIGTWENAGGGIEPGESLEEVHHQMEECNLVDCMSKIDYQVKQTTEQLLPNGKKFVRLDLGRGNYEHSTFND